MTKRTTIAIILVALTAGSVDAADFPPLSNDTVITISADESWEDAERNIIHFRGNFKIQMPNWALSADLAAVFGKLDDPQRIVADGSPVTFVYRYSEAGKPLIAEGEGRHLEYDQQHNLLRLTGDARLATDRRIMQSSEIQYDLDRQKLEAGGPEGVQITIDPDPSGNF